MSRSLAARQWRHSAGSPASLAARNRSASARLSTLSFAVVLAGALAVVGISYGPAAAFLPEIFATRYRYTAAGVGYNLAGILGGALPLIVAPPLTAAFGGIGVGIYMAVLGVLSAACTLTLPETKHVALDRVALPVPAGVQATIHR